MPQAPHLVCPACLKVNRVQADRLTQGPVCGACRAPLHEPRPVTLTRNNFEAVLRRTDLPVLVDFWAPWCAPCRAMAPAFDQAAGQLYGQAVLAKLDTQEELEIADRFHIQGVPTMVLFLAGREISRVSGAQSAQNLTAFVRDGLRRAATG